MKPLTLLVFSFILVLGACHQATSSASLSAKQAAQLVMPLQGAIGSVQSGIKLNPGMLAASVDATQTGGARAISPQNLAIGPNSTVSAFPLDPATGEALTPDALYKTLGGVGTKRFPATGFYYDISSVQTNREYFFYMTPAGPGIYTICLYNYPLADFSVYYTVENYTVDESTGNSLNNFFEWGPQNDTVTTYYLDGTTDGGAKVLATSTTVPSVSYSALNPGITTASSPFYDPTLATCYTSYTFPLSFCNNALTSFSSDFESFLPTTSGASAVINWKCSPAQVSFAGTTYSLKTVVNNSSGNAVSYYTEVATGPGSTYQYAYGLMFSTDELVAGTSSTFDRTVARYYIDFAKRTQTYRSLTSTGSKWGDGSAKNSNIWKFTAVKTDVGQTGGLITVNQSTQISYPNSGTVAATTSVPNIAPDTYIGYVVTQTSEGATSYSGTQYQIWNGTGNSYSVTINQGAVTINYSGSATLAQLSGTPAMASPTARSAARAATATPSFLSTGVAVPLQPFGTTLTIPVNGGTFTGTFSGTQFTGTFTYGSVSVPVTITAGSVTASGTTYPSSQLLS